MSCLQSSTRINERRTCPRYSNNTSVRLQYNIRLPLCLHRRSKHDKDYLQRNTYLCLRLTTWSLPRNVPWPSAWSTSKRKAFPINRKVPTPYLRSRRPSDRARYPSRQYTSHRRRSYNAVKRCHRYYPLIYRRHQRPLLCTKL